MDFLSRSLPLNPLKMREMEDCFILLKGYNAGGKVWRKNSLEVTFEM